MRKEVPQFCGVAIDEAPPIPMQIGSPERDDFTGYEVELLKMVGVQLGCKLQYHRAFWSVITEKLSAGHIDLICSAAAITTEREKSADFCTPHLELRLALVGRQNDEQVDLRFDRIGCRRGTTAESYFLSTTGKECPALLSESNEELYSALSRRELEGVIDDSPIAMHFSKAMSGCSTYEAIPTQSVDMPSWSRKETMSFETGLTSLCLYWKAPENWRIFGGDGLEQTSS